MNLHLLLLVCYSAGLVLLGLAVSRRVQSASGFFVANRQLNAALVFSTVLAATIGAGSTVGATGLGYRDGLRIEQVARGDDRSAQDGINEEFKSGIRTPRQFREDGGLPFRIGGE